MEQLSETVETAEEEGEIMPVGWRKAGGEERKQVDAERKQRCFGGIAGGTCLECGLSWRDHSNYFCCEYYRHRWRENGKFVTAYKENNSTANIYWVKEPDSTEQVVSRPVEVVRDYTSYDEFIAVQFSKEELKMQFSLIEYSFTAGTTTVLKTAATADEVKTFAEVKVAAANADLTKKNFFSLFILDGKSGQLVSVYQQAPPVVAWTSGTPTV